MANSVLASLSRSNKQNSPAYESMQLVSQLDDTECSQADTFSSLEAALAHAGTACALNVSFQSLSQLPNDIGKLHNLKEFRGRGTQIASLPPAFWSLESLRLLDVMDSDLAELPADIAQLTQLRKLEVGGTHITSLPPELNALRRLKFLDIMDTAVKALPEDMSGLKQLQDVDIDETAIKDVSPLVGLPITRLIADYDGGIDIAVIPRLTSLKELSLSGCLISELPSNFGDLRKLVKLNLSNNSLSAFSPHLRPMPSLRQVNLANNNLAGGERSAHRLFPRASITGIDK